MKTYEDQEKIENFLASAENHLTYYRSIMSSDLDLARGSLANEKYYLKQFEIHGKELVEKYNSFATEIQSMLNSLPLRDIMK